MASRFAGGAGFAAGAANFAGASGAFCSVAAGSAAGAAGASRVPEPSTGRSRRSGSGASGGLGGRLGCRGWRGVLEVPRDHQPGLRGRHAAVAGSAGRHRRARVPGAARERPSRGVRGMVAAEREAVRICDCLFT